MSDKFVLKYSTRIATIQENSRAGNLTKCNLTKPREGRWEFFTRLRSQGLDRDEYFQQVAAYYELSYDVFMEQYEQMEILYRVAMDKESYEIIKKGQDRKLFLGLDKIRNNYDWLGDAVEGKISNQEYDYLSNDVAGTFEGYVKIWISFSEKQKDRVNQLYKDITERRS